MCVTKKKIIVLKVNKFKEIVNIAFYAENHGKILTHVT